MSAEIPSISSFDWRGLLLVVVLAFAGAASFQGSRGLYETTEGRYAECARETLATGDWDDPVLNGQPHWTKPPLTYMAIMAGTSVLGRNPWGVRAYLVVAMVLAASGVWLAGFSIWGAGAGRWAGVVFATSPAIVAGAAHVASADMLTVLWVALSFGAFWYGYARQFRAALLAMWACLGLGFLTKGPPALLVPAAALPVAWHVLRQDAAWHPPRWVLWTGLVIFTAVGLGWYLCEAEQNRGLISYWIGDELVGRNVRDEFHRNPGLWFAATVYLPLLLLGTGPWLALALWRGRPLRHWWKRQETQPAWRRAARVSLAAGVVIPFAVFSFSTSKLPLYLAPLFVPLALLLGRMMDLLIVQGRIARHVPRAIAAVTLLLLITGKGIMAQADRPKDMTRLAAAVEPVLAREAPVALYTATGRYLNGLEFELGQLIEFIQPTNMFTHMTERLAQGESPRYLMTRRNWERVAGAAPFPVRQEPLGRHWLLLAPIGVEAGPDN